MRSLQGGNGRRSRRARGAAGALVALAAMTATALAFVPATGALTLPKGPHSFKIYQYKLESEGSGTYTHNDGPTTVHASFKWNVKIGMVLLEPKSFAAPPDSVGLRQAGGGQGKEQSDGISGSWDVSVQGNPPCTGSGGFQPGGPPLAIAYINPLVKGGYLIDVQPSSGTEPLAEKPSGAQDCADIGGPQPSDFWHDWPANEGAGDNAPALQETVHVTPAKEGKVIQEVKVDGSQRPRSDCQCTFEWSGRVTLTRTKVIKG